MIQAFVSSTYNDLKDHRAYVIDRLARGGIFVDPMEKWTAASDEPKTLSQDRVRDCDFCVLLVGFRRGHIPDGETHSITQLEYIAAKRRGIQVFIFMANDEADWPIDALADLKNDPEMGCWRALLKEHNIVEFFTRRPESIDVDSAVSRWHLERSSGRQKTGTDLSWDTASDATSIDIRAYCNSDGVLVAWRMARQIKGCLGFAIHRRVLGDAGITDEVVDNWLDFPGSQQSFAKSTPSTIAPIQNFRLAERLDGQQEVRYRVVPVMGPREALSEATDQHAGSGWTRWLSPRTGLQPGCRAFFNRAVPRLASGKAIDTEDSMLRQLRGNGVQQRSRGAGLQDELRTLLIGAKPAGLRVYAALADLDDADLVEKLKGLRDNLYLLLSPAPIRRGPNNDAAKGTRASLRSELRHAGVHVYEQALRKNGTALSNFAVFCDKLGTPLSLWTGSTGWTTRALCLRSNSGILIESAALVRAYLDLWDELRGNAKRPGLPVLIRESEVSMTLWATPTPSGGDLRDVTRLIRGARQGIMFLINKTRAADDVMEEILRLVKDQDLFIEGISWSRGGNKGLGRCEYRVNDEVRVVGEPSSGPPFDGTIVLIDPFGPHPTVMTGSHDLSAETSARNQSDLLIIENAAGLAAEYAVHVARLLANYRWRSTMARVRNPTAMSLQPTDEWQRRFFDGTRQSEFNFLFGSLSPGL